MDDDTFYHDKEIKGRNVSSSDCSDKKSSIDDVATNNETDSDTSEKVEIPRNIGLFGGIAFIVGTIIGSGIFISPKGVAEGSGSVGMAMVSWTICGIISLLGSLFGLTCQYSVGYDHSLYCLRKTIKQITVFLKSLSSQGLKVYDQGSFCYAELGTVIKKSGADYIYLHESYGQVVSYTFSWVNNMLVKPASMATITLTCAQYIMTPIFNDGCGEAPTYIKNIVAIVFLGILASINIYSAKLASRIQIIFTVSKLLALAIIIIGGIVRLCQGYTEHLATGFQGTVTNPGQIAVGLYSGMWSYEGWNTANFMTEEIINPERNLPLAIVIGVPLVMILYTLTNISYFTVMSVEELIASPAVAITWAETVIPKAAWIIPIFVAMSAFGTGNGSLFSGGRLMFAAGREEHLPDVMAMVHVKKYTPSPAIILTVTLATIFLLAGDIGTLIDFISFISWGFYGLNMLAVIIFRYKKPFKDIPRVVKIPLVIPVFVFLASIFLVFVPIITNPQIEFLFALVFIAAGFLFYIPFVVFKVRFGCTRSVTTALQLYLQVLKPKDKAG